MREDIHGLTGAHALHALDGEEAARFEQHLAACVFCREEVASLGECLADLSALVAEEPPPSLRSSVLDRLASTPQDSPEDRPEAGPEAGRHRTRVDGDAVGPPAGTDHRRGHQGTVRSIGSATSAVHRRWPTSLAAAAAAIVLVGGGYTVWRSSHADPPTTVSAQQVLDAGDSTAVVESLSNGGSLTVTRSMSLKKAVLVTSQLPAPPMGKIYQLWFQEPSGTMEPAGSLPAGGDQVVVLDGDAQAAVGAGITLEPDGGSPAPTTDPLALFVFT